MRSSHSFEPIAKLPLDAATRQIRWNMVNMRVVQVFLTAGRYFLMFLIRSIMPAYFNLGSTYFSST